MSFTYTLTCPVCGSEVEVQFGRRSTDRDVVRWQHDGCHTPHVRNRCDDFFETSLPTDENGNLIPPEKG